MFLLLPSKHLQRVQSHAWTASAARIFCPPPPRPDVWVLTVQKLRERPGWIVGQSPLQPNWNRQNFSPSKVIFLFNSYLSIEGALNFSPTKRNLLLIPEIPTSWWEVQHFLTWWKGGLCVRDTLIVTKSAAMLSKSTDCISQYHQKIWGKTPVCLRDFNGENLHTHDS